MGDVLAKPLRVAGFSFGNGGGGAANAAYRLHTALRAEGVEALLYVLRKQSDDPSVIPVGAYTRFGSFASQLAPRIDQMPIKLLHPSAKSFWSTGWYGSVKPQRLPGLDNVDVICLYWITRGVLGIQQLGQLLATNKPVVWRLSDMWPFTGGCHYSAGCERFEKSCGACPQLSSSREYDLSKWLLRAKKKHVVGDNLTVVSPSRWMADKARVSSLFRDRSIRVIPTGVDCNQFQPAGRRKARGLLNLPKDRPLVLYGATSVLDDPRKGADIVTKVISRAYSNVERESQIPCLVLFGTDQRPAGIPESILVYSLGVIRDDAHLALVYSACDVFVAPSREENLANTVLEAMACGLPVLAFDVGGMSDAVSNGVTGLLYKLGDYDGFGRGLQSMLDNEGMRNAFSTAARTRAETVFSLQTQARSYISLYDELRS